MRHGYVQGRTLHRIWSPVDITAHKRVVATAHLVSKRQARLSCDMCAGKRHNKTNLQCSGSFQIVSHVKQAPSTSLFVIGTGVKVPGIWKVTYDEPRDERRLSRTARLLRL